VSTRTSKNIEKRTRFMGWFCALRRRNNAVLRKQ